MDRTFCKVLAIGFGASFTTSLDELLVLMVLFSEVEAEPNGALKAKHVVTGLNLGFSILVTISLTGVIVGLMVPDKYLGLMGFAPILIGLKKLCSMCIKAMRKRKDPDSQSVDSDATDALEAQDEEEGEAPYPLPPTTPVSRARSLCRQTELVGTRQVEVEAPAAKVVEPTPLTCSDRIRTLLQSTLTLCHPSTLRVAAIIVSDGGDTLSVYLPLFATFMHSRHHSSLGKGPLAVATLLVIAYSVLAMWCGVAQRVVKMPILRTLVTKWGRFFVPLLLIGIGAYVLFEYDAHLLMGQ